jgi:Ni/Co efflux regulator RcnB
MRRFLISLLLASTAASPALAAPRDRDDREQTRSERQEARSEAKAERQQQRSEARSERSVERSGGQQRPQFTSSRRANDDDGSVNRSQRMVRNNDGVVMTLNEWARYHSHEEPEDEDPELDLKGGE